MNLPPQLFSTDWLWLCNFFFGILLLRALPGAPWRTLLGNAIMINALAGLLIGLFVFWQLNAGIRPGLNFHLIGATLCVLMFGWQIALATVSTIMTASWFWNDLPLITLGLNGLLMVALPVALSEGVLRFSQRHLPKNLFLFVLGNGFGCAALTILSTSFAATLVLLLFSAYTWAQIQYYYLVGTPILMLTEAFATGAMITAFTVFQPDAVMNFSDEEYLVGK